MPARIGLNPRLVRSDTFFLLRDIAASAGFIKSASRALKYVSSLFDSNASLGRFIDSDCNFIDEGLVASFSERRNPLLDLIPLEKMITPHSSIISERISEKSLTLPFS